MTISVTINIAGTNKDPDHVIHIPDEDPAFKRVAGKFNPKGDVSIDVMKALAAAAIKHAADMRQAAITQAWRNLKQTPAGESQAATNRCAAEAMQQFEGGAMWAVKAYTAPANHS